MSTEIETLVSDMDSLIRQNKWFDFHVLTYNGKNLTIAGSTDLTYHHNLEIVFEDVFFVSGFFSGWHSDTSNPVFVLPDNELELNRQFEIEEGYQLFVFKTEDYKRDFVVAAKNVSFNADTVYYYNKEDLKENERVAAWLLF